ncbi:regulator of chromosome condensation-like [Saccostrea cucullata]|uniref:regulator of chromosome condensation-like n=1 Tax=Saccostrea cuccullata TaxID=36930 RepID=UPI002ED3E943
MTLSEEQQNFIFQEGTVLQQMPGRGKKRARESEGENKIANKKHKITHPSHPDVTVTGVVLACGEGDVGQLGLGPDVMEKSRPALINIDNQKIVSAVAGGMHTVCLTNKGEVYTFGCNDEGALGRNTSEEGSETLPGKVDFLGRGIQLSAGDSHSAVLTDEGKVFAWGNFRDANGKIGLTPEGIMEKPIEMLPGETVVKIASGGDHLLCLTEKGEIYSCGCAEQGQLGRVAECFSVRGGRKGLEYILKPGVIRCLRHKSRKRVLFDDVFCGQYMSYAREKETGAMYAWGLNNYYQLGKVYTVGRGEYGRLGHGDSNEEKRIPAVLDLPPCKQVAAGQAVSYALTESGEVYAWGMGTSQQLGSGEDEDITTPQKMTGKQLSTRKVIAVSGGGQHTVLLASEEAS